MIKLKVHKAKNLKEKVQGLIGAEEPKNFLLKTRWGIHTIGLKFPIDILILDNNNQVVTLRENLKPNNLFVWHPKYSTIIELSAGTIKKKKINTGKIIEII